MNIFDDMRDELFDEECRTPDGKIDIDKALDFFGTVDQIEKDHQRVEYEKKHYRPGRPDLCPGSFENAKGDVWCENCDGYLACLSTWGLKGADE